MRKMLLTIALIAMIIIFGVVAVNGINIGNITVWGFNQIKEENQNLKDKNDKLSNLVDKEYPRAISTVAESEKQLKATKEEYESQIALNSNSETSIAVATEKYEIEYLWTKIGNHAKDNDVDMKIDLTSSSVGTGYYKLNFTVTGSYVGITDFIYAIENDSKLGFKIDNFIMTQNTETTTTSSSKTNGTANSKVAEVKATFSCDEVGINIQSIEKQTVTQSQNTTNTTNTTKTTSSSSAKSNTTSSTTSTGTATKAASNAIDEATGE